MNSTGLGLTLYQTKTILDQSKFKAFADDILKVVQIVKYILGDKIENIVGKEENAGYQHFLLFPQCFQKAFSYGSLFSSLTSAKVCEKSSWWLWKENFC